MNIFNKNFLTPIKNKFATVTVRKGLYDILSKTFARNFKMQNPSDQPESSAPESKSTEKAPESVRVPKYQRVNAQEPVNTDNFKENIILPNTSRLSGQKFEDDKFSSRSKPFRSRDNKEEGGEGTGKREFESRGERFNKEGGDFRGQGRFGDRDGEFKPRRSFDRDSSEGGFRSKSDFNGERRFGDRPPRFNRDAEGGDRPQRYNRDAEGGDRPPRFNRDAEGADRPPRFNRSFDGEGGDRPRFNRDDKFGDRPPRFNRDDKFGDRPPRFNRDAEGGDRPPRFNRDAEGGDRPPRFNRDTEGGDRPPRFNRDDKFGDRPPRFNRDDKFGDRPPRFNRDAEGGDRPPRFNRDAEGGDRPPRFNRDDKFGDRPPRFNRDDKFGDRPPRFNRDAEGADRPLRFNRDDKFGDRPPKRDRFTKPETQTEEGLDLDLNELTESLEEANQMKSSLNSFANDNKSDSVDTNRLTLSELKNKKRKDKFDSDITKVNKEEVSEYTNPQEVNEEKEDEEKITYEFKDNKKEYLYGAHTVEASISFNYRKNLDLFVQMTYKENTPDHIARIIEIAKGKDIKIKYLTKEKLDKFTGGRPHNGLVLKSDPRDYVYIKGFEAFNNKFINKPEGNLLVLLDQIVDPQNFGSIVRSAFFLGADGILLNKKNKPPISSTVCKVSSGASECTDLFAVKSLRRFLSEAIEKGWTVVTTSIEKENDVQLRLNTNNEDNDEEGNEVTNKVEAKNIALTELNIPQTSNIIVVLGSEANGITSDLIGVSNYNVYIPPLFNKELTGKHPYNIIDSLNVGVSAGIIINHIKTQLKRPSTQSENIHNDNDMNANTMI